MTNFTLAGIKGGFVNLSGTIAVVADTFGGAQDCQDLQSVSVSIKSASLFAGTIVFEVSNDGTNWNNRTLVAANGGALTAAPVLSAGATLLYSGDIGGRYFRVRVNSVSAAGTVNVVLEFSAFSIAPPIAPASTVSVSGSGTASIAKAEDVAHASGDLGVPAWTVRAPATPVAPASAAGDYSITLSDAEGKLIAITNADPINTWQASIDATTTTATAVKAAAAAGLRNYITDLTIENTGASAARVIIADGATRVWSCTVPAGQTLMRSFETALRGTAATAVNVTLGVAGTVSVSASGFIGI